MTDLAIGLTCIEQIEALDEDGFYFWGDGSEQYILKNGVIRQQAYKHILTSKTFAEEYLNLIRADQIELEWQTQNLIILDKLSDLIKGGRWDYHVLAPLFREAMLALAQTSEQKLSKIQCAEAIEEAIEMGYQYYEFKGLVDSSVEYARRAALHGMIRKFAEQYSAEGGYNGDLFGSYYFYLSKPRIADIIPWLTRDYHTEDRLSARIQQLNDGTWSLQFFNILPFNDIGRLNLAVETYSAAIPVLEHALEMDAAVCWELSP